MFRKSVGSPEPQPTLWTREFCLLCVIVLAINIGMQMLNSLLALYVHSIGGTATDTGLIAVVFMLTTLVGRTANGRICNSGRYQFSALLGASLFAVGMIPMFFSPVVGIIFLCRALQGYGYSGCGTAATTGASFLVPESRLGEGLGYIALCSALAIAIGPAIGLKLVQSNDYRPAFLAIIGCCLLCILLVKLLRSPVLNPVRQIPPPPFQTHHASPKGIWHIFERGALPLCLVQFLISFGCAAVNNYVSLFAEMRGFSTASLFFTGSAAGMILVRLISGKGVDRYHPLFMLVPSLILCACCIVFFRQITNAAHLPVLGIVFGLSNGMCIPLLSSIVMKHTPRHRRGSASATFYISVDLGIGFGSLVWGRVIDSWGFDAAYLGAALCLVLALVVGTIVLFWGERSNPTRTIQVEHCNDQWV